MPTPYRWLSAFLEYHSIPPIEGVVSLNPLKVLGGNLCNHERPLNHILASNFNLSSNTLDLHPQFRLVPIDFFLWKISLYATSRAENGYAASSTAVKEAQPRSQTSRKYKRVGPRGPQRKRPRIQLGPNVKRQVPVVPPNWGRCH